MSDIIINTKNIRVKELSNYLFSKIPNSRIVNIASEHIDIVKDKVKIRLTLQANNIIIKPKKNIILFILTYSLIFLPLMILQNNLTINGIWIGAIFIFVLYALAFFLVRLVFNAINKTKAVRVAIFVDEIKAALEFIDLKNSKNKEDESKNKNEPTVSNKEEDKEKKLSPENSDSFENKNVVDYENLISDLKKLFLNNLLTKEEYDEKFKKIQDEQEQKNLEKIKKKEEEKKERQKIIFEERLETKTKTLIDLIIDAKNKNLITEIEYQNKEKEIIEKCKSEIEYEDLNRPQVSEVPNDFFSLFSVENQVKIKNLIKGIELGDMVVLKYEEVNSTLDNSMIKNMEVQKFKKEQWKKILESHEKEKKYVIIINFEMDNIFIIKDKTPLINIGLRKTKNYLTEDKKETPPPIFVHKKEPNNGNDNEPLQPKIDVVDKPDDASKIEKQEIDKNPKPQTEGQFRGDVKKENVDYRSEIEDFTSAIKLHPDYFLNYYRRGYAWLSLGYFKKSIKDFSKAIDMDPQYALAYFHRGHAKNNISDYQGAIADYTKAIEIDPLFANAYFHRGYAYIKLKQKESACADFDKANELGHLRANEVKKEYCN